MLSVRYANKGFTLVELMVALAILGVLMAMGLPTFLSWIQNAQIRNSAESILNGLQLARAQAVKTNANVQFMLTNTSDPSESNVATVIPSVSGTNWLIRNATPVDGVAFGSADFIQGRTALEGSRHATVSVDSGDGSFVFTPLGRLLNPLPNNIVITVNNANTYDGKRPMSVIISPGGQIRMCDPDIASKLANPTNPQFC